MKTLQRGAPRLALWREGSFVLEGGDRAHLADRRDPNGDSKAGSLSVAHPAGPGKRLSRKIVDGKILTCDCALFLPLEDFGSD